MLALSGVLAYRDLGQAEDPEFTIKLMTIKTLWPGATALEVEAQVTERIEKEHAEGLVLKEAIVEASVRRLRPILLTAAASVLAMVPLSFSTFWGPMAMAIMGGLVVATLLTLLFLPALYAAWFKAG